MRAVAIWEFHDEVMGFCCPRNPDDRLGVGFGTFMVMFSRIPFEQKTILRNNAICWRTLLRLTLLMS